MRTELCGSGFIMCDAYIDQNHRIGDTYIGYKCTGLATKQCDGKDLCDICAAILETTPSRVSWALRQDPIFPEDLTKKQVRMLKRTENKSD